MLWEYSFPSILGDALGFIEKVLSDIKQAIALKDDDIFALRLSLEEALINAIKHGNQLDKDKKVTVICRFIEQDKALEIEVADEGMGYPPGELPDPTSSENIYKLSGRGIYLIKKFMDKVEFLPGGRKLKMVKYLKL